MGRIKCQDTGPHFSTSEAEGLMCSGNKPNLLKMIANNAMNIVSWRQFLKLLPWCWPSAGSFLLCISMMLESPPFSSTSPSGLDESSIPFFCFFCSSWPFNLLTWIEEKKQKIMLVMAQNEDKVKYCNCQQRTCSIKFSLSSTSFRKRISEKQVQQIDH